MGSVNRIRDFIAECRALTKYVRHIHRLFGWPEAESEVRSQEQQLRKLIDLAEHCSVESELAALASKFEKARDVAAEARTWWSQNPIPIRCDDATLESLAQQIEHGRPPNLTKSQIEMYFDMSRAVHFWEWMPEYTRALFLLGPKWSYPDADLFAAMAQFHDQAILASQDVDSALADLASGVDRQTLLFDGLRRKKMYACQTIVNACLLVEAFINGLASVALNRLANSLSPDEQLYLREQKNDRGQPKAKNVRTEDKLKDWVRLMSPRSPKVGLNIGVHPAQDFFTVLKTRHSIIHLAESKVDEYDSIDHKVASRAVRVAIDVIREICRCVAKDDSQVAYPGWLKDPSPDGLFRLGGVARST